MHIFDVLTHVFSFMAVIKYPQYILQIHMDAHTYTHTHKDTYETSTANGCTHSVYGEAQHHTYIFCLAKGNFSFFISFYYIFIIICLLIISIIITHKLNNNLRRRTHPYTHRHTHTYGSPEYCPLAIIISNILFGPKYCWSRDCANEQMLAWHYDSPQLCVGRKVPKKIICRIPRANNASRTVEPLLKETPFFHSSQYVVCVWTGEWADNRRWCWRWGIKIIPRRII